MFKLVIENIIAFSNFGNFAVHTGFEMNVILPSFIDFSSKRILLPDHFVQVSHADLGHDGLFLVSLENGSHARIASGLFTDMIDDIHHSIGIPPFRILNTFHLSTHNLLSDVKGEGIQ